MFTKTQLKKMSKSELENKVYDLEIIIANMKKQTEKDLVNLMPVMEELDTVGIICGKDSKQRAKAHLKNYLVDKYGENYEHQYKNLIKDNKKEEEVENNGK